MAVLPISETEGAPEPNQVSTLSWLDSRRAQILLLIGLVVLGAVPRFYKLTELGVAGSDTVYYTNLAIEWSQGNRVYQAAEGQAFAYRPVVYMLFGAALSVLGHSDHAIKQLNAAFDVLNVLLIYWAGFLLLGRKHRLAALCPAVLYALAPSAIFHSRIELTHVLSTTMVLGTLQSFLLSELVQRPWLAKAALALAGVFAGLAVLTHEELGVLVGGYLAFMVLRWLQTRRSRFRELVLSALTFVVPFVLTCSQTFLLHFGTVGPRLVVVGAGGPESSRLFNLDRAGRLLWNGLIAHGSGVSALLLVTLGIAGVVGLVRAVRSRRSLLLYLPLVLLGCYTVGYVLLLSYYQTRLFLPIWPLTLLFGFSYLDRLLESRCSQRLGALVLIAATISMAYFAAGNFENRSLHARVGFSSWLSPVQATALSPSAGLERLERMSYTTHWNRQIVDALADQVDGDNRLLVASSVFLPFPGRRSFQLDLYFGDNAVHLIDHEESLDRIIEDQRIAYVLLTKRHSRMWFKTSDAYPRYLYGGRWERTEDRILGGAVGLDQESYTVNEELKRVREYLEAQGAELLWSGSSLGIQHPAPVHRAVDLVYKLR